MNKDIAVITVTFNTPVIEDFLSSLIKQKNKSFHLFITNISSKNKEIESPGISSTIILSENKGYAYGVNRGIEKALTAGYTRFLIINDDTFFKEDFIEKVIDTFDKHPSSLIGGKIYYAPDHEYHRSRYKESERGNVLWYAGGSIDWAHIFTPQRGVDEVDKGQYDKSQEVDFITGCLLGFDKNVVDKVGLWDESYFLYFEDTDYCVRAKRSGIKLLYDPSVVIWHKVSQSTGGSGSTLHQKYQNKNRVRFGLKYAPLRTKLHLLKNYALSFLK